MGNLQKMKLTAFSDEKFSARTGAEYVVMLNPDSVKWNRRIEYSEDQAPDNALPSAKYKATPAENLSFDIVIDTTGVVDVKRVDLPSELEQLRKVIYNYNGKIHRPNFVGVYWGTSLTFLGVLRTFDTSYTLFKPDGTPLRAKISLSFSTSTAPSTAAKEQNRNSPDLTHLITVVAGDSLPQLAAKVLHEKRIYPRIAQFNGLDKFRNLQPGTRLVIPPVAPVNGG